MSFANINIGTTPGDHSGDPLRVAFNKINNNFQQIANGTVAINVNAPVKSVAGRTGNVVLTSADVIGSVTMGDVQAAMTDFAGSYVTKNDLNSNIHAVTGNVVTGLNTLEKIALSLDNNPTFGVDVISNLASKTTQITSLQGNAVIQAEEISLLSDSIAAANVAIAQNSADIQTLFANAASQTAYLDDLTANAAGQGAYLISLTSNAAVQASYLADLTSNAVSQQTSLASLFANASIQDASLNNLIANAVAQQSTLGNLLANVAVIELEIGGANAAIVTANTAMKAYVDVQTAYVNQLWGANAESVQSQLVAANAAIVTANTAMKAYVDAQDLVINANWQANAIVQLGQITGANAAIVTANTAMKGYVDAQTGAVTSAWTANAIAQQAQIANLIGSAYSNSNVAAYLPVYGGDVLAQNLVLTGNLQTTGSFATSKHQLKGFTGIGNYVEGTQTSLLVVNATSGQPAATSATMQVVGPTGGLPVQIALDAHTTSAAPTFIGRRSRGNVAVPAAVQNGDLLVSFSGKGHGTTNFNTATAPGFGVYAAENFTDTAQGTYSVISYTTPGSTNTIHHTRFDSNGNVLIVGGSTSTSPSTGALVVNGGVGINGNLHVLGNISSLNSMTVLNDFNATGSIYANSRITTNTAVYSPKYYFANGTPLSFSFDTVSATNLLQTYGGNMYFANINAASSTLTGDGSGLPLNLDFTQTIASHTLQAEGSLVANSNVAATTAYTGALLVPNGGAGIYGNLYCAAQPGARFQVGQGGTYFNNAIAQFTGDQDGASQINMQNIRTSANAASEVVATANDGTQYTHYMKMGICNSIYSNPNKTAYLPLDGYINADGGNLILSAERPNTSIKFINGGYHTANIIGTWNATSLTVNTDLSVLGNIAYTPANASNWNSSITTIKQALDELAQRLKTAGF